MAGAALDSHAYSIKHTTKMSDCKQGLDKVFFKKEQFISAGVTVGERSITWHSSKTNLCASNRWDCVFNKDNPTNAEIVRTLKVKVIHFSFGSYLDLGKLFKAMFPNSEIAEQFL